MAELIKNNPNDPLLGKGLHLHNNKNLRKGIETTLFLNDFLIEIPQTLAPVINRKKIAEILEIAKEGTNVQV